MESARFQFQHGRQVSRWGDRGEDGLIGIGVGVGVPPEASDGLNEPLILALGGAEHRVFDDVGELIEARRIQRPAHPNPGRDDHHRRVRISLDGDLDPVGESLSKGDVGPFFGDL
jgi:hypothetical protein